jgi:hypothetical protein
MSNAIVRAALLLALVATAWGQAKTSAQAAKDPHRPVCTNASCRKIKSFLKSHYCGESPYGNGPEDGCLISQPKKLGSGIKITADFVCRWRTMEANCQQHGHPSPEVRRILVREMRGIGLPAQEDDRIHFTVWESSSAGWSLAKADYDVLAGNDLLALCQVEDHWLEVDRVQSGSSQTIFSGLGYFL